MFRDCHVEDFAAVHKIGVLKNAIFTKQILSIHSSLQPFGLLLASRTFHFIFHFTSPPVLWWLLAFVVVFYHGPILLPLPLLLKSSLVLTACAVVTALCCRGLFYLGLHEFMYPIVFQFSRAFAACSIAMYGCFRRMSCYGPRLLLLPFPSRFSMLAKPAALNS